MTSISPTEEVVTALHSLVTFTPNQAGAYREFFAGISKVLGDDFHTRLQERVVARATSGDPGVYILTGNAGTGKTSVLSAVALAIGAELPNNDELVELGHILCAKDVSAIAGRENRAATVQRALQAKEQKFSLLCINEGILRDVSEDLWKSEPGLGDAVKTATRDGFCEADFLTVVDLNRQRFTAPDVWRNLLDFVSRSDLWNECGDCPVSLMHADIRCPLRANAEALRDEQVRGALRDVVRIVGGDVVPTVRELLSLLAYAIVGEVSRESPEPNLLTCQQVRERFRERGVEAFTSDSAFYNLLLGSGLPLEMVERSPLMAAIGDLAIGAKSNLKVDEWLRDASEAPALVQRLAGSGLKAKDQQGAPEAGGLARVKTGLGSLTFANLGERVTVSEDPDQVEACVEALVSGSSPAQVSWRRNLFFRGGASSVVDMRERAELVQLAFAFDFLDLTAKVRTSEPCIDELNQLVAGLNYLATGFLDTSEGLLIPEPSSLFARDPGSFRRADPAFLHTRISLSKISLCPFDPPSLEDYLDTDSTKIVLYVDEGEGIHLHVGPFLFEAIIEAQRYQGPVSHRWGEMTQLRAFYGEVVAATPQTSEFEYVSIADPLRGAVVKASIPRWALE